MKDFFSDLYGYSKNKFTANVVFMILSGITNGIGIVMLIPLINLTGLSGNGDSSLHFLSGAMDFLNGLPKNTQLITVLSVYVLLIVSQSLFNRKMEIMNTELTNGYQKYCRTRLYEATVYAEWITLAEKKKSEITNSFTLEINKISSGSLFFLKLVSQTILASVQIYIAFMLSFQLSLFVITCGLILYAIVNPVIKSSKRLGNELQMVNKKLTAQVTEQLAGIKEVKSYGIESEQIDEFEKTTEAVRKNFVDFVKTRAKPQMLYQIGAAVIISVFFYFSMADFEIAPSSMFVIIFVFSRLWPLFSSFQSNLQNILISVPSFSSYKKLLEELGESREESSDSKIGGENEISFEKSLKMENVCFRYESNASFSLKNICMDIESKKMTAIVGKSGAGKSTIADILMGFIYPESGSICIDGRELDKSSGRVWRKSTGYVSQTPFLFSSTVKENLTKFNPNCTEAEIYDALELAAAKDFVLHLPEGIDTFIGDGGVRLSGGERQRIVLARALLRKPKLLILDEATSSLDRENEYRIQKSLERIYGKMTIVVIAHRLSTIRNADSIIVLDDGAIIESGKFEQLKQLKNGSFRKMLEIYN